MAQLKAQTPKTIVDFAPGLPRPAVLCTLVSVVGSAPQEPGARMWVTAERFEGTLGGGRFEAEVLAHARTLVGRRDATAQLKAYVLCKEMGQCCGGRVQVFFEPVLRRKVAHVFGGGHVGRALASVLAGSPVEVVLIEPREEWSGSDGLPEGVSVRREDPAAYVAARVWDADDAACILTHSHDLDFRLVSELMRRPLGYLGLIGSAHKARVFQARLVSAGTALDDVERRWEERVRCPMGAGLRSKNPKAIAIAIASEVLTACGAA
ncbi:MAG: xanthine dehydrogenase accessory protein XdhC [Elusimicrobia bacterium]|nr:xanthine dehydrogenase accessory protein XdhC [Elusimicrobiota bacterium]